MIWIIMTEQRNILYIIGIIFHFLVQLSSLWGKCIHAWGYYVWPNEEYHPENFMCIFGRLDLMCYKYIFLWGIYTFWYLCEVHLCSVVKYLLHCLWPYEVDNSLLKLVHCKMCDLVRVMYISSWDNYMDPVRYIWHCIKFTLHLCENFFLTFWVIYHPCMRYISVRQKLFVILRYVSFMCKGMYTCSINVWIPVSCSDTPRTIKSINLCNKCEFVTVRK